MTKGAGKPCGASFISSAYICRVGEGSYSNLSNWKGDDGVKAALDRFETAIEQLNPDAQRVWRNSVNEFLGIAKNSRKIDIAIKEIGNAPTQVVINGELFPAPINMVPRITRAQFKWENPVTGTVFNKAENGISETNGVSLGKSIVEKARLPFISAAKNYKSQLEAEGKTWPAARSVRVTDEEVEKEWQAVKGRLWSRGGNNLDTKRDRNELEVVYKIQEKNPSPEVQALRDAKEKAIVRTWLEHDKLSPVTGLPVKLPTDSGREVTVDHIKSYDAIRRENPKLSPIELSRLADTSSNYYVVEAAPNNWKGNLPSWGAWIERDQHKDMGHLAAHLQKKIKSQPEAAVLTREQFVTRFPSLSYDNPADRKTAVDQTSRELASALLTGGGRAFTPAPPREKAVRATRVKRAKVEPPPRPAPAKADKRAMVQRAAQLQLNYLRAQGMSLAQALSSMKKLYPPQVLVKLT